MHNQEVKIELTPEEERVRMILRFWACGADILHTFNEDQIAAVPGLREAIDAVFGLPEQLGWVTGIDDPEDDEDQS